MNSINKSENREVQETREFMAIKEFKMINFILKYRLQTKDKRNITQNVIRRYK